MSAPFYALYVLSERKAAAELREAGLDVFEPTFLKWLSKGHSGSLRPVPLLPGYVFARLTSGALRPALACEHVVRVLSAAGVPRSVPEPIMSDLIALVQSGRMDEKAPVKDEPKPNPPRIAKARSRGIKARGLKALNLWFDEAPTQDVAKAA